MTEKKWPKEVLNCKHENASTIMMDFNDEKMPAHGYICRCPDCGITTDICITAIEAIKRLKYGWWKAQ